MEVFEALKELINTMGFPIAMVIYFIWDKNKTTEKMIENQNKTTDILCETLQHNTDSLTRNTNILEKLLYKLDVDIVHE